MIGILTEKPSAAKNFATALHASKDGANFTGCYEGQYFIIVHSFGHLYGLLPPRDQVRPELQLTYADWDITHLPWDERDFNWQKTALPNTKQAINNIVSTLSHCSEIVLATDNDPTGEGDLLAGEILLAKGLNRIPLSRMYFDDEAPASIQTAFLSRKPIPSLTEHPAYKKGLFRQRFDYLSQQHTRIASYFAGDAVLRQGRLKSVMVNLVGSQLEAVRIYKKIPFYQIRFRDENGNVFISPDEPMYPTKAEVPLNYESSKVIVDVTTTKHTAPPKLLDLAGLSASLAGSFKASDVLQVYQHMYERQIVSYPRTADKCITPEQFAELLPKIDRIAAVVGVDSSLLTHRQIRKTHVTKGGAHGANRPGPNVPSSIESLRNTYGNCGVAIYTLLARNFLAMFAEDYIYEQEKGHLEKYPAFVSTTNIPKSLGFKKVFDDSDKPLDAPEKHLGTFASPSVFEGFPKPPVRPTMAWIMKQLEKNDVGTGATRTSIYADLTNQKGNNNKYPLLQESKGKITMTSYGELSYKLTIGTKIADVKMTEAMQQAMRDVANGTADPDQRLHEMQDIVKHDIAVISENAKALHITVKEKPALIQGVWNGIPVAIKETWVSHRWTKEEADALFAGKEIPVYGLNGKDGKTYDIKGRLEKQTYKGKEFVGFAMTGYLNDDRIHGTWNGKSIAIKKSWGGHTWTKEELDSLFAGEEITISDLVSPDGSTYSVAGKLAEQTYNGKKFVGFMKTANCSEDGTKRSDDRVTGIFRKKQVSIKSSWNGHTWTDEELKQLFAGKEISVYGFKSKNGNEYGITGKLAKQTYNGRSFVGFKRTGFAE